MLGEGGIGARIEAGAVPVIDGAWELLDAGAYPGGSVRNLDAVRPRLRGGDERTRRMLADAQTSGGLLIAVPPDRTIDLLDGFSDLVVGTIIGDVVADPAGTITLV